MLITFIPAAILFWCLVHPFVQFWRKFGRARSYRVICSLLVVVMALLFLARQRLLWLVGIMFVVFLEERELLRRFGDEYRRYCQQTPRFIPKFSAGRPLPLGPMATHEALPRGRAREELPEGGQPPGIAPQQVRGTLGRRREEDFFREMEVGYGE